MSKKHEIIIKEGFEKIRKFPNGKRGRRKAFLRVRSIDNKKCFFDVFFSKCKNYNRNDLARRMFIINHLKEIFNSVKPIKSKLKQDRYTFETTKKGRKITVVIQDEEANYQLISIY